jgi:hypothetical protein
LGDSVGFDENCIIEAWEPLDFHDGFLDTNYNSEVSAFVPMVKSSRMIVAQPR